MKSCSSCGCLIKGAPCTCPHCGVSQCSSSLPRAAAAVLMGLVLAQAEGCFVGQPKYGMPDSLFDSEQAADEDGDGYDVTLDCNDGDAAIHPDATETAGDGVDSNCDGQDDT